MLVTMLLPTATASATTTDAIAVGSYVQFGTYYGQPILWRVINKDANGTMILMDKIIGVKAFDASGDLTDGRGDANRQTYGSNYWEKSNLREWLNSNAATVTFSHQVPDAAHVWTGYSPYSTEAGFLSNLTTNEQNAINSVTHKALVTSFDQTVADGGSVLHTYNSTNPSTAVQNYTTAYYKNITDKVFPLSIKELNDYVYSNATLGDGATYHMTKPTATAISNTTYTNAAFNT